MAERARLVWYWLDSEGRPIPAATVNVRNAANNANILDTIYVADDPDTSQHSQGFASAADGRIEFYLTNPKRVTLRLSKSGYTSQDIPVDVSLSAGNALTVQDEGTDRPVQPRLNFIGSGVTATDDAGNGRTNVTIKPVATDPIWDAAGDLVYGTGADAASRLAIGTAGQVLKVNSGATAPEWGAATTSTFIGAKAYRTSSAVSVANNLATVIDLNAEEIDSDAFHDNVTNSSRLTVPTGKAGRYLVIGQLRFAANATGNRRIEIQKNGTRIAWQNLAPTPGAAEPSVIQASAIIDMAATDYFQLVATQTSGGALDIEAGQYDTFLSCAHQGVA